MPATDFCQSAKLLKHALAKITFQASSEGQWRHREAVQQLHLRTDLETDGQQRSKAPLSVEDLRIALSLNSATGARFHQYLDRLRYASRAPTG
ncbi:hypothetical protein [Nitrosococcus oceani]|uniref:hypothetical protein n=1 Tax=Nitrosococcus oceani TaxID=1229 RepID=UPI0018D2ABC6|nr:hypothetical protein [Nitrosococcus oceani]